MMLPDLGRDIPAGKVASGIFLGAMSVSAGLLNAASMSY
jgi:putative membrane protein